METPPQRSQDPRAQNAALQLWDADRPDIHELLAQAEVEAMELLPRGSNATFLLRVNCGEAGASLAVYKPQRGEAPLWDFPDGTLFRREYAAYLVSQALGWPAIPPMVIRSGPHGIGTVQLYVDHNPRAHYFTFGAERPDEARRIALFDAVANNADRKGGHCLQDASGKVWSIDHGLTFNTAYKLRTVIWEFQGEPIPDDLLDDLSALLRRLSETEDPLAEALGRLITAAELRTFSRRIDAVLAAGTYPTMGPTRNTPWPPV